MTSPEKQQKNIQNQNYVEENSQRRSNKVSFSPNDAKNESSKSWQQMPQDEILRHHSIYLENPNESFQKQSLVVPQQDVILSQQSPNFNIRGPQQDVPRLPSYNVHANYNINVPSYIKEPYFLEGSYQNK